MKTTRIIALVLAGAIGTMSVLSGTSVLLGLHKVDYTVLNGLVVYNIVVGGLSMITAYLIWKNFLLSKKLISVILLFHALVLAYLYFFIDTVATESIKAMAFRVIVWLLIFLLIQLKLVKKGSSTKTWNT
ncbi:hypothetical protein HPE56_11355 [Maribacter sp. ANRC-HE7]|uniref:Uncharacterized protein n=1 Tax=Maribacter aquimaris TaxID=2737171 RepID=A0ABR7V1D5_9FLAO|nr:hypothetical protein [Maribacter aquimaris]MBD0778391.1 hypothetical protein [Maribacter aquimaris]